MADRTPSPDEVEMAVRILRALRGGQEPPPARQLVTLDQLAAIVRRSKYTLKKYVSDGRMPAPAVEGGGGRPNLWNYADVRGWLIDTFHLPLPEQFPGL